MKKTVATEPSPHSTVAHLKDNNVNQRRIQKTVKHLY